MRTVRYADDKISNFTILVIVPSIVIAVGILTYPRTLAEQTEGADGWVTLLIGGAVCALTAFLITKIASLFPGQSFYTYTSAMLTKPVAFLSSILFFLLAVTIVSYETAFIANISHHYLFEKTPTEAINLAFLLVVLYAVVGERVAIFRMGFGIMILTAVATVILVVTALPAADWNRMLPVLTTDVKSYLGELPDSILSYSGVFILFFYMKLTRTPEKSVKSAVIGAAGVTVFYITVYLMCIAVLGNVSTANTVYPLVELANTVRTVGFLDRIESLYFIIWITTVFMTTALAFDISVLIITDIFPKANKTFVAFSLLPVMYLISLLPTDHFQIAKLGTIIGYTAKGLTIAVLAGLWLMYGIKGRKRKGERS
ncbi:endospore germination permease [Oceanobacillus sp. CFH 90083]|uniref:GerAB/ArcD/ProY family transporter n=1 Tax=Oceanobacillus sp. CFH 90083 TaxID=2592336 RepID=UPI00128B69D2|nr:endospore germination permease [Oceanobacillus sp. CFH 90083]